LTTPPAVSQITPEVLEELRSDMLRFATMQLRDSHLAEDMVQDTMMTALAKSAQFAGRSSIKTWVFTILRNNIIDAIHKRARTVSASDYALEGESLDAAFDHLFKENAHWSSNGKPKEWSRPDEAMEEQQFWAVFDACMEHLPENTARVFMMREILELTSQEICETLAISTSNCHVILHRARAALRKCLEGNWFTDDGACVTC